MSLANLRFKVLNLTGWACVGMVDFYHDDREWIYQVFKGTKWQFVNEKTKRAYLKNAYRVLLTRSRQGMVIFVPRGDPLDHTRPPLFYDGTFDYLRSCGIPELVESAANA